MNYNDEFDHVLEEALAEYRGAEPLAGMEHRILQRLRMQAERRRKAWLRWSAFAACTAILAIAVGIGVRDHSHHEIPVQPVTAQQQKPPVEAQPSNANARATNKSPAAGAMLAKATHSRSPNVVGRAPLTRTDHAPIPPQFPTPTPMNSEERALLALAQTHPEVLSPLPSNQDDQEIAIAPIDIQPLANEATGNQGEN